VPRDPSTAPRERIAGRLTEHGIDAELKPVDANLEDVFVAATQKPARGEEAHAA